MARHTPITPDTVHQQASNFSHAVLSEGAGRTLHISGQVGMAPDGGIDPDSVQAQIDQAWDNVIAVLRSAGMGVEHLVKVTVFLTDAGDIHHYRRIRDAKLGGHTCASTLLVVSGLAHPHFRAEIEAVAMD